MPYRVWDNGVIRDATEEEIKEMRRIPPPIEETNEPIEQEVEDNG